MIGYTRKLSAAEELEQLRPQVYDAELRALQHKALRLVLDCTGVMNEKQLAAIAEIKLRYKAVQEFYGPECKHRDVANRDRVEMAHRYAVAHSGSAQAEISKEGDTYTAKLCYPSKAIERASFVTMRSAMLYVQESFACEIPE